MYSMKIQGLGRKKVEERALRKHCSTSLGQGCKAVDGFFRMRDYFIRRFLLIPPTLLGITLIAFFITRIVPGGPIERALAESGMMDMAGGSSGGGDSAALSEEQLDQLLAAAQDPEPPGGAASRDGPVPSRPEPDSSALLSAFTADSAAEPAPIAPEVEATEGVEGSIESSVGPRVAAPWPGS